MKTKKMNNKGFSLVELIVVIAIMAILVGALAPALLKYVRQSRQSADIQAGNAVFAATQAAIAEAGISGVTVDTTLTSGSAFCNIVDENLGGTPYASVPGTFRTYTTIQVDIANDEITVTLDGSPQFASSTITSAGSTVGAATP